MEIIMGNEFTEALVNDTYRLSTNFHKKEFNQKKKPLPMDAFDVNPILVDKLEVLRSFIGDKPISVTSGYRTKEYNKGVGGASKSQHMGNKGASSTNAADIQVKGMSPKQLELFAKEAGFTFTLPYSNHLHVDVRGLNDSPIDPNRPTIQNPDGSISTERTITIKTDKGFVNIPTIINGKQYTAEEAISMYKNNGEDFGVFGTAMEAESAARRRSKRIGEMRRKQLWQ